MSESQHLQHLLTCLIHCRRSLVCCMCLSIDGIEFMLIVPLWPLPASH